MPTMEVDTPSSPSSTAAARGPGPSARPSMQDRAPSLRSFTEAVPLSLSSLAHESVPLEQGVLDGMEALIQHTLTCCVQYARAMYAPYTTWTVRDLVTSQNAWKAVKVVEDAERPEIPPTFQKRLELKHVYVRHCMIYINSSNSSQKPIQVLQDVEMEEIANNEWIQHQSAALAKISLYYASEVLLTPEEMNALSVQDLVPEDDDDDDEEEEAPPATLLYKVTIDYRTVPPNMSKKSAKQAEELSMLSFGGSVDDDVKYGALASLYDPTAKYVLEIYSLRGKKYKFDLIQSTLSDGSLPEKTTNIIDDPFAKSLCVTVTNTPTYNNNNNHNNPNKNGANNGGGNDTTATTTTTTTDTNNPPQNVVTTMHLTLEGQLLQPQGSAMLNKDLLEQQLPSLTHYPSQIMKTFPLLNPQLYSPHMVTSNVSKHTLLLKPEYTSKVYVNGRYMTMLAPTVTSTTTNNNNSSEEVEDNGDNVVAAGGRDIVNSSIPSLFGFDLLNIPTWHGRIMDYESMRMEYVKLWQEILTDVNTHQPLPGGGDTLISILLQRLMTGYDTTTTSKQFNTSSTTTTTTEKGNGTTKKGDSDTTDSDEDDDDIDDDGSDDFYYDTEEEDHNDPHDPTSSGSGDGGAESGNYLPPPTVYQYCPHQDTIPQIPTTQDCLETEIMSNPKYDPVGVCAQVLGTYFYNKYGATVYPCLAHQVEWVRLKLGDRIPKVVPLRLLKILRRCGYTNIETYMSKRCWKFEQYLLETKKDNQVDNNDEQQHTHPKREILKRGMELLHQAGIQDVLLHNVIWVSSKNFATLDPFETKLMCRYHPSSQTFFVNDALVTNKHLPHHLSGGNNEEEDDDMMDTAEEEEDEQVVMEKRAFLLGMYIAQEHPDGTRLVRYLLRHSKISCETK